MRTDATGLNAKKAPPPALPLLRIHSRTTRVVGPDDDVTAAASTPSLHTPVTVPFLWEDAPGRPKPHPRGASIVVDPSAAAGTDVGGGGDPPQEAGDAAEAARVLIMPPLKLPPRLQVVPSKAADRDASLSPKTVLPGPYYGCTGGARRPPPRTTGLRRAASFRRTPSAGGSGGFFSRRKAGSDKKAGRREVDSAAPDASSCSSPSPSSASSSSSSASFFFFGDERGHGTARAYPEEGETAQGSLVVRITRFRRNRSLPTMTTSHLWASIRKGVKQIAPWS